MINSKAIWSGLVMALALSAARRGTAQELNLSVGYLEMPGRIGDQRSDHGLAVRLSGFLGMKGIVTFGGEIGVDRFNEVRSTTQFSACYLAGGGIVPCTINQWARDWVLSAAVLARLQTEVRALRPFLTVGIVASSTRTNMRQTAHTDTGTPLPNLSFEGSSTDGALAGQIGIGSAFTKTGLPFQLTIEGRVAWVVYNYSGGWQDDTSPSILVGIRWQR